MEQQKYLYKEMITEISEKKSRFIGRLFFIDKKEQIKDTIKRIRSEYKDASHCTYAYIIDDICGSSDDGEPSGTAGIQILQALQTQNINNCLAVVIRYFGGTLLGASLLLRTYKECALSLVRNCKYYVEEEKRGITIKIPYSMIDIIKYKFGTCIESENYTEAAIITLILNEEEFENIKQIAGIEITNVGKKVVKKLL